MNESNDQTQQPGTSRNAEENAEEEAELGKKPRKKRVKMITSNDTYKCKLCSFTTGYIGMFDRHLKKHASEGNKYIYTLVSNFLPKNYFKMTIIYLKIYLSM